LLKLGLITSVWEQKGSAAERLQLEKESEKQFRNDPRETGVKKKGGLHDRTNEG